MHFESDDLSSIGDIAFLTSDNLQDYEVKNFIGYFCNPKVSFEILEGSFSLLWASYPHEDPIGIELIRDHLKKMPYSEFLKTVYWKCIAYHTKWRADFKCVFCASPRRLEAHHRDYSYKGIEILNLKEVNCVCDRCHEKHHFS